MLESSSHELLYLSFLRSNKGMIGHFKLNITASGQFFQAKNFHPNGRTKAFLSIMSNPTSQPELHHAAPQAP